MPLDFSRSRLPPFNHQREDTEWLIKHPCAFIASEMRTGKSKIVVDAAQFLFEDHKINNVIVVCPAPVRDVWANDTWGQVACHAWTDVPNKVVHYHARTTSWVNFVARGHLTWYVTNFEFIGRSKSNLQALMSVCNRSTLLVGDESSFLKNWSALQTKAFAALRKLCGRVVLLNGTPIFHSPKDLYSQGNLIHPCILECPYISQFMARYAIQEPVLGYGGKPLTATVGKGKFTKEIIIQQVAGWSSLDDLERRFKPYTVRRLQAECLDLPPKLDPINLTATFEPSTWKTYKQMRDDLVVWLQSGEVVTSATAAIRALRLSQITGGFLSGIEPSGIESIEDGLLESLVLPNMEVVDAPGDRQGQDPGPADYEPDTGEPLSGPVEGPPSPEGGYVPRYLRDLEQRITEVGREKLDVLLWLIEERFQADQYLHLVVWGRFRAEVFRAYHEVKEKFPQFDAALVVGNQKVTERRRALALLHPETSPRDRPVFVAGIEGTGSFGLNMTAAHTCVSLSSGYSSGRTAQTLDRVYGPGQTEPIAYFNILATGPKGQKTIDHDILGTRLAGENIAQRTAQAWVKKLMEE